MSGGYTLSYENFRGEDVVRKDTNLELLIGFCQGHWPGHTLKHIEDKHAMKYDVMHKNKKVGRLEDD